MKIVLQGNGCVVIQLTKQLIPANSNPVFSNFIDRLFLLIAKKDENKVKEAGNGTFFEKEVLQFGPRWRCIAKQRSGLIFLQRWRQHHFRSTKL